MQYSFLYVPSTGVIQDVLGILVRGDITKSVAPQSCHLSTTCEEELGNESRVGSLEQLLSPAELMKASLINDSL